MTKLLLYCVKAKPYLVQGIAKPMHTLDANNPFNFNWKLVNKGFSNDRLNGKIVAECDYEVEKLTNCGTSFMIMKYNDMQENYRYTNKVAKGSCLDYTDLRRYLGTNDGYAIHIKNLHIFDKPQRLTRLTKVDWEKNIDECIAKKGKCNYGYSERYGNWIGCIKAQIDKAPQNMMRVIDWNGEIKILISIQPQWLCKILNGEKTIEVRKKVLKEMV